MEQQKRHLRLPCLTLYLEHVACLNMMVRSFSLSLPDSVYCGTVPAFYLSLSFPLSLTPSPSLSTPPGSFYRGTVRSITPEVTPPTYTVHSVDHGIVSTVAKIYDIPATLCSERVCGIPCTLGAVEMSEGANMEVLSNPDTQLSVAICGNDEGKDGF